MSTLRTIIGVTLSLIACSFLTGCDSYGTLCEAAGECVDGNDLDVEACINDFETESDVASVYGCEEEWDLLVTCIEEEGRCEDDDYVAEGCDDEEDDYDDCTD